MICPLPEMPPTKLGSPVEPAVPRIVDAGAAPRAEIPDEDAVAPVRCSDASVGGKADGVRLAQVGRAAGGAIVHERVHWGAVGVREVAAA